MATEIAGPAERPPTRADDLKFALAFALRSVRLDRHRLGLSEETRYRIAGETVDHLLRDGRWPELNQIPVLRPLASAQDPNDHRIWPK
jgi:hypothetical protein